MNKLELLLHNPSAVFMLVLLFVGLLLVAFILLVLMGNLLAMRILAKCGVAVFSNNIIKDSKLLHFVNKDGVGWLNIPEVCYAPIMKYSGGKYMKNNFLKKPSLYGEVHLAEGTCARKTDAISLKRDNVIQDLSIIRGSAKGNVTNLRKSNFALLSRCMEYINTNDSIEICENGKVRRFEVGAVIDKTIADKHSFKYDSREDFLDSLLRFAKKRRESLKLNNPVVLLQCSTEIDTLIVLLIEK